MIYFRNSRLKSAMPESAVRVFFLPISVFAFVALSLGLGPVSRASAEGIFWTDELLDEWKVRAQSGPFKSAGDAFDPIVPGEWERIESSAAAFRANPSRDRLYNFASKAVKNHQELLDASLYALVRSDAQLAGLIKDEILWQVRRPESGVPAGTTYINTDDNNWWRAGYLCRIVVAADLIRDYMSASEFSEVSDWLREWASIYEKSIHQELSLYGFPNRYNRDYATEGHWVKNSGFRDGLYAYQTRAGVDKNQIAVIHKYYNNRKHTVMMYVGLAAAFTGDPVLIDRSKLFFEEWLSFSVFPDGSTGEYQRNGDYSNPIQGLLYNAHNLEAAVTVAFALSQIGDDSLFTFETRDGRWGSESKAGEPAKTLELAVVTHLDLMENKKDWYAARVRVNGSYVPVDLNNPPIPGTAAVDYRIDNIGGDLYGDGKQFLSEIWFAPIGNLVWQKDRIKSGYMRSASGSVAWSKPIGWSILGGPWRGHSTSFPSCLFMYAGLEDAFVGSPDAGAGSPGTGGSSRGKSASSGGVIWDSVEGTVYLVEYSDDGWVTIQRAAEVEGTGGEMKWSDPDFDGQTASVRRYRVAEK